MAGDDYIPIDVSVLCNAHSTEIPAMAAPLGAPSAVLVPAPVGRQTFRGLPFLLGRTGRGDGPDLVLLGGQTSGSVRIPVGAHATWLIFVHRLLETEVYGGANVGGVVADYVVRYEDGASETIPIRERFE